MDKRTCPVCESDFAPRRGGTQQTYCTAKCRLTAQRKRAAAGRNEREAAKRAELRRQIRKVCIHCGETFTPKKSLARQTCSDKCRRARSRDSRTRTCSAPGCNLPHRAKGLCSTHYNHEHQPNRRKKVAVSCTVCGVSVQKHVDNTRRPVCSYECRYVLVYGAPKPPPPPKPTAPPLTVVKSSGFVWVVGVCEWCGGSFTRPRVSGGMKRCSDRCTRAAGKAKRREARGEFSISPVRRRRLYERDNWTCQLCFEPVDREAHYGGDWAPSLDHIVPQSHTLIPDHSDENLRTAHRWCNAVRGDLSYYTDADLLVGA